MWLCVNTTPVLSTPANQEMSEYKLAEINNLMFHIVPAYEGGMKHCSFKGEKKQQKYAYPNHLPGQGEHFDNQLLASKILGSNLGQLEQRKSAVK